MEGNERRERAKDGASGRRKEREKERGRGKGRGKKGGGKAVGFLRGGGGEGMTRREGPALVKRRRRGEGEGGREFRAAINAVELTPGWPFAGKVRLKERRNGRQLPPCKQAVEGGVGVGTILLATRNVYNTTLENRSRFIACLIFRLARSYVSFCHIQSDPDIDDTIESFVHRSLE